MAGVSGKAFDFSLFGRVLKYVKPYSLTFFFTGLLTLLSAILGPLRPVLIQYTLDEAIIQPDPPLLVQMTIILIVLLLLEAFVQFYQTYLANWVGQSVIRDLRAMVYRKILGFKLKYFDRTPIGTLVTRVISDIETIADIFSQGVLIIIGDVIKLVVVIAIMFATNWQLSIVSLLSLPFLLIATRMFQKVLKSAFQDIRTQVAQLNTFVQEHITGMNVVQIFNREKRELEKFKEINKKHRQAHVRTVYANAFYFPVVELLSACSLALLVWWGGKEALSGSVTYGELVAFILYIYMLFRPIRQLADRFNILQMGMVGSERVFGILDTEQHIEDIGEQDAEQIKGHIEFKDVWFAYTDEDWVLKGISFETKPGERFAFVGATGAGKTSIINLLNRNYEFQKGQILIDGIDIRSYKLQSLREHIGIVLQDVFLFSDSILNNITLGDPSITEEQVREAAEAVGASDFIERLKGDYSFDVKERGGVLSVGQRQLIAFIRAYVYKPEILILDEATSSVDSDSEELIQRATEKITKGRTSLIIAHRLATIQYADCIVVLDKGKIVEQGSHQQLLMKDGQYKVLYEMQFKDS
ncbi:MAG TPA: antibiotic ABC transporter ATP-binding protein [Flavobacteriales bacterium]|jgi:ATP-binding cassette subfamily B protein|nr:antibiotic ABC transporter ATP-binding protein [Flavobacteriales bacterium]